MYFGASVDWAEDDTLEEVKLEWDEHELETMPINEPNRKPNRALFIVYLLCGMLCATACFLFVVSAWSSTYPLWLARGFMGIVMLVLSIMGFAKAEKELR